ncbi:MAG TPA: GNAT family N-acetyltransferase [Roseovarius sp.]|nr:GNAT family N-acetyltransferase [Roseovarius sp.]
MSIARARLWHVLHLARILWAFTRATSWLPPVRGPIEDLRALARVTLRGWVRVVRDGSGIAAFIVRDGSRVHALYVAADRRGQGYGGVLLAEAKGAAGALDLWVLERNADARAFYAAQGFREAARGQGAGNDEGLPDILMIWSEGVEVA